MPIKCGPLATYVQEQQATSGTIKFPFDDFVAKRHGNDFRIACGGEAVSQQALTGARATSENWKVMKAAPREALTNTAVATSTAPERVSRTIVGQGRSGRAVHVSVADFQHVKLRFAR